MSFDRLITKINEMENPSVVGLDATFDKLPQFLQKQAIAEHGETLLAASQAVLNFNKALIDALYDIVPAVKPQCAYYEMLGFEGMRTLYQTTEYAKQKGMFVIHDGKRNDIGSTMEAYAAAHLGETTIGNTKIQAFGADALTVNGYLGTDGIQPLLDICKEQDKGIFVLAKTSNPSSGELQDKMIDGKSIYNIMGHMCEKWGESVMGKNYSGVGAVVGATYPEQLAQLRKELPRTFFLVPGYGAQGGGAKDVAGAFYKGQGAIINNSRGIMYAYKNENCNEKDFAQAARRAAIKMKGNLYENLFTHSLGL